MYRPDPSTVPFCELGLGCDSLLTPVITKTDRVCTCVSAPTAVHCSSKNANPTKNEQNKHDIGPTLSGAGTQKSSFEQGRGGHSPSISHDAHVHRRCRPSRVAIRILCVAIHFLLGGGADNGGGGNTAAPDPKESARTASTRTSNLRTACILSTCAFVATLPR